jgi:hypothetical protein
MSFETVAAKVWVAPATIATGVVVMATLIGVKVTEAVAVFVVSDLLVAVMVAAVVGTGVGAVYTPPEVMVPAEAVQVTPGVEPSLVTVAVNVVVAPATMVAVVGVTATLIAGGAEPPPNQPHPTEDIRANAAKPANMRENRRTFDMGAPFFRYGWKLQMNQLTGISILLAR